MDWLRNWALAAGCAAIAGGLALTLSPESGVQRVLKLVMSAFFLCCLIVPLGTDPPDFSPGAELRSKEMTQKVADELQAAIDDRISSEAGAEIEREIIKNLEDLGLIPLSAKIYIVTDRSNQASTSIMAEIVLDQKYSNRHDELVAYLKNKLGVDVRLGYE